MIWGENKRDSYFEKLQSLLLVQGAIDLHQGAIDLHCVNLRIFRFCYSSNRLALGCNRFALSCFVYFCFYFRKQSICI